MDRATAQHSRFSFRQCVPSQSKSVSTLLNNRHLCQPNNALPDLPSSLSESRLFSLYRQLFGQCLPPSGDNLQAQVSKRDRGKETRVIIRIKCAIIRFVASAGTRKSLLARTVFSGDSLKFLVLMTRQDTQKPTSDVTYTYSIPLR